MTTFFPIVGWPIPAHLTVLGYIESIKYGSY